MPMAAQATSDATTVPLTKSPNIISDTPNGETVKQFNVDDYNSEHLVRPNEKENPESSASPICCYNSIAKLKNNRNNSVHERLSSQWDAYGVQNNRKSKRNGVVAAVDRLECCRICSPSVCCCCIECQSSSNLAAAAAAATVASSDAAPNSVPHSHPPKSKTGKSIVLSNNNNSSLFKNKNCQNGSQRLNGVTPTPTTPPPLPPPPPTSISSSRHRVCDSGNCDRSIGPNLQCRENREKSEENLKKLICCSTNVRVADKQTAKLFTIGVPVLVKRASICKTFCDTKPSIEACCDCRKVIAHEPAAIGYTQLKHCASSAVSSPQRTSFFKCRYVDTASRLLTSSEPSVHSEKFSAPAKSVNINANDFDGSIVQTQHQLKQPHIDSDNQNNRIIQNGDDIAARRLNLAHRSSATKKQIDLLRSHFKDVEITSSETATTPTPINVHDQFNTSSQAQRLSPASATTTFNWRSDQQIPVKNDRGATSSRNTDHKYERPLTENNVSNRLTPKSIVVNGSFHHRVLTVHYSVCTLSSFQRIIHH